jgi:pyruvate kinase
MISKYTNIVATISPKVATKKILSEFIDHGVNVFRLNFSHGSHEEYVHMIRNIKEVREEKKLNIGILQDLQGPRVRVGDVGEGLEIAVGDEVILTYSDGPKEFPGKKVLPLDHNLTPITRKGEEILIEDGLIQFDVISVNKDEDYTVLQAKTDALIKSRKGVNFPGSSSDFPVITEKDVADLKFGLEQEVDFVAMSFVRSAEDIKNLKELVKQYGKDGKEPGIIAKIEKPDAITHFPHILEEVYGVMVARGDLGIEIPAEHVPIVQKNIIKMCMTQGKQVIVATQMLDSMIRNPRPTRAEVSDVANAVIDHTDAVMLSGETSGGAHPLLAVQMMTKIIQNTEQSIYDDYTLIDEEHSKVKDLRKDLAFGAQHLAKKIEANAIIVLDPLGKRVAEAVSQYRPGIPVFTFTLNERYYYQTSLTHGVTGILVDEVIDFDDKASLVEYLRTHQLHSLQKDLHLVVIDMVIERGESIQVYTT